MQYLLLCGVCLAACSRGWPQHCRMTVCLKAFSLYSHQRIRWIVWLRETSSSRCYGTVSYIHSTSALFPTWVLTSIHFHLAGVWLPGLHRRRVLWQLQPHRYVRQLHSWLLLPAGRSSAHVLWVHRGPLLPRGHHQPCTMPQWLVPGWSAAVDLQDVSFWLLLWQQLGCGGRQWFHHLPHGTLLPSGYVLSLPMHRLEFIDGFQLSSQPCSYTYRFWSDQHVLCPHW